ncbi:MAG: hypothetical protein JRN09_05890 [Nitrososphaerota archaeon]|nr:hypothetical protein [Nitrososphaerota archaeon]
MAWTDRESPCTTCPCWEFVPYIPMIAWFFSSQNCHECPSPFTCSFMASCSAYLSASGNSWPASATILNPGTCPTMLRAGSTVPRSAEMSPKLTL